MDSLQLDASYFIDPASTSLRTYRVTPVDGNGFEIRLSCDATVTDLTREICRETGAGQYELFIAKRETALKQQEILLTVVGQQEIFLVHSSQQKEERTVKLAHENSTRVFEPVSLCDPKSLVSPDGLRIQLVLIGDAYVGKTSLLRRYACDEWTSMGMATIGIDFKIKTIMLPIGTKDDDVPVKLLIWDTAGSERFRTITSAYYRGAQGALLLYSVQSRRSFENIHVWIREFRQHSPVPIVLVGSQCDCSPGDRDVSTAEGGAMADEYGIPFVEVSAKHDIRVSEPFVKCAKLAFEWFESRGRGCLYKEGPVFLMGHGRAAKKCC